MKYCGCCYRKQTIQYNETTEQQLNENVVKEIKWVHQTFKKFENSMKKIFYLALKRSSQIKKIYLQLKR